MAGCAEETTSGGGEATEEDGGARFVIQSKRGSSCLQMPDAGEGKVRFYLNIRNAWDGAADFEQSIHVQWYSVSGSGEGGWVDTPLNDIEPDPDANPSVKPGGLIRFREDLDADPGKLIARCAARLEDDDRLVKITVLR